MALLAKVYLDPSGAIARDVIARELWPSVSRSSALHSLSQSLYSIKQKLTEDALVVDPRELAAGDLDVDFLQFIEATEAEKWKEASDLLRGQFLQGIAIADAVAFNHWLDAQRAIMNRLAVRVISGLEAGMHWQRLRGVTDRMLAVDDGHVEFERARRIAIRGLESWGTAHPSLADGEVSKGGRHRTDSSDPRHSGQLFVGRTDVLRYISHAYQQGVDGSTELLLITGEAGIGKTALVDRASKLLALRGASVIQAKGHSSEQNLPLGIVEQWLTGLWERGAGGYDRQPWMDVILEVFPSLSEEGIESSESLVGDIGYQRLLESLRKTIAEFVSQKPVALVVDDIHWADSASMGFLHYLLRHQPPGPAVVVATARQGNPRTTLDFADWKQVKEIRLRGLEPSELAEWLRRLAIPDASIEETSIALYRRTGGNPLLASALIDEGQIVDTSGAPPGSIVDFYRPRILGCSQAARRLLGAISIADEPQLRHALAEIAGLPPMEAAKATEELVDAQLAYRSGDDIELRHGVLGEVALSVLSPSEKQGIHGKAARLLSESGGNTVAFEAVSYDVAGDRSAAFAAARQAAAACDTLHARREKEFFLKLALSNAPSPEKEGEIRIELAELLFLRRVLPGALDAIDAKIFRQLPVELSRRAEAVRIRIEAERVNKAVEIDGLWTRAERLRSKIDPFTWANTSVFLAGVAHDLGFRDRSLAIAERIIDEISSLPFTAERASSLMRPTAIVGLHRSVAQAFTRFDSLPEPDVHDPVYSASYYSFRGSLLVGSGRLLEAEEDYAKSIGLAHRFALFDHYFSIHNNLGVCLMEQGRYEEAEEHYKIALQHTDPEVSPGHHWITKDNLMILDYERGRFDEAIGQADALTSANVLPGVRARLSMHGVMGLSCLETGDLARCREAEREAKILLERHGNMGNDLSYVHVFLARMNVLRGAGEQAVANLAQAADMYKACNFPAYARVQLESCRISQRLNHDLGDNLEHLLDELQGTGAVPLIERAEALKTRLTNRA